MFSLHFPVFAFSILILLLTRPYAWASFADFSQIRRKKEGELRNKLEAKAKSQAFANALATIGKFIIKKRAGDKDQIFGSVQVQEVADAILMQTGQDVSKYEITMPDIKSVGTYECTIRLHPEVRYQNWEARQVRIGKPFTNAARIWPSKGFNLVTRRLGTQEWCQCTRFERSGSMVEGLRGGTKGSGKKGRRR